MAKYVYGSIEWYEWARKKIKSIGRKLKSSKLTNEEKMTIYKTQYSPLFDQLKSYHDKGLVNDQID